MKLNVRFLFPAFLALVLSSSPSILAQTGPGSALSFDGTNDFAQATPSGWTTNDSLTVEGWIYRVARGVNMDAAIASKSASGAQSSSAGEWMLGYGWGTDVIFRTYCISNSWPAYNLPSNGDLGQWHHLAGVYDSTNSRVRLYVDGVLRADLAAQRPLGTNGLPVWIGRTGSEYLNGQLDEVRLWRTVRTAAEIADGMGRSLIGSEPGLLAYWRFNEGSGLTTADATANAFTAGLSNGVSWVTSTVPFVFAPAVATLAARVTNSVGQFNATVNPNNAPTTAWFEWGSLANAYLQQTPPVALGGGGATLSFSNYFTGFTAGKIYHYRVVASNTVGVVRGNDALFGSPTLALNGPAILTNECHFAYTDPTTASNAPLGAIAAGAYNSLVARANGTVIEWGRNNFGQTDIPPGATNVIAIAAGSAHSLAVRADGSVIAWGDNSNGQTTVPANATNIVAIAAGVYHTLALRADGSVMAWGDNSYGQTNIPANATNVVAITAGLWHNLALRADGSFIGWGDNIYGVLDIPANATNVVAIASGYYHTLALRADGSVIAWGQNSVGETNIPANATNVAAIAVGAELSVALRADGSIVAWGNNNNGQTNVPASATNVVAIAAGDFHILALRADGTIVGWGKDDYGQVNIPAGLNLSTLAVNISGSLDLNTPGSYVLNYTAANSFGGIATASRTVVVADTLPPVVTLNGSSPSLNPILITNLSNLPLVDPGATAFDLCRGSISVITSSNVNLNYPGTYAITYHATDASGNTGVASRTVVVALPPAVPGDQNGDGIVSQTEFNSVLSNYLRTSPWLALTNVAGLGSTNVTFALSNSTAGAFSVEFSTNLSNWYFLGPATPRYEFNDTNAPASPQRFYRLRWP